MKKLLIVSLLAVSTALYAADQAALSSANPVERANAAQTLGREKDVSGIAALTKLLNDSESNVAHAAAQALAEIGNDKAADALLVALKAGKDAVAGDAALVCARARCAAKDEKQRNALLEACYVSKKLSVKYAALSVLATLAPTQYASAIEAALTSGDLQQSIAAVKAVKASEALIPIALKALSATQAEAKARIIGALTPHVAQAQVKPVLLAALSDESEAVRIAGLHAAVASNDPVAFAPMFAATLKDGEEARVAMLMFASSSSKDVDSFLYEQMKQVASRSKAIELLASRHQKELIGRLCDASLYAEKGVNQAAAGAFRVCLQAPDLAKAMTFVFSALPADKRTPLVSALSSVVQQLPGTEKVAKDISVQFAAMNPEARADALDVLAALQTPEICKLLIDQAKTGDVEYRKAIVRTLAKWNQPVALDALVDMAKGDADHSIKILATRAALNLLEKKGIVTTEKKVLALRSLALSAEREEEKQLIDAALKGVSSGESRKQEEASPAKKKKNAPAAQSVTVAPVAVAKPDQIRVLVLTGANNHNWQETTASLKKVYATNPKFFVTVNETPWDMTPDSLTSCDVVFFNWNTFGKDKREWSQTMKDAFIPWVKKGGNVVIFHAGGSIFYNWPEFMSLIGGTWEKGTFHPAQQEYTVKIGNPDHPITKGMKDFITFDEPWQKLSNRNPDRKVLTTTTIPKEKTGKVGGGTGEPEVMAMTTELEKGRCFNLVLGHSGKSIENEGCSALILRGTEWAATGAVR